MKRPPILNIIQMNNASCVHFGIEHKVYPILQKYESDLINAYNLNFGINLDGLP